jgi:flagellar hook-associated protein 2
MTISVGGLISGLDTNDIISQMLEIQQRPILALQKKEAEYQVQLSTYGNFKSVLSGLKTALNKLDSPEDLTRFSASSGDTDLFTAAADGAAATGNYKITVSRMAEVHKLTSTGFSKGEAVGEGTLHLRLGTGGAVDIDISATDTIQDVAKAVNNARAGIKAAVIFDGTNYFLSLAGEETGQANEIRVTVTEAGTDPQDSKNTDTTGLSRLVFDVSGTQNMNETQSAADAILTVDGVADIRRSTNVIDDVIEGVTLTLASAPDAPDNTTALSITRETVTAARAIDDFVAKFNSVLDFIATQQKFNAATGEAGQLLGDATTNTIRNNLKNLISGSIPGEGEVDTLADLGIAFNKDGRLEVNSDQLAQVLKNQLDDAIQFFTGATGGNEGFAVKSLNYLEMVIKDDTGTLTSRTKGIQNSIGTLQNQAETMGTRNAAWEARTRAQFNAMELLLAQYQNTGDYLSQQIVNMQNFNSFVANRR